MIGFKSVSPFATKETNLRSFLLGLYTIRRPSLALSLSTGPHGGGDLDEAAQALQLGDGIAGSLAGDLSC